MDFSLTDEQLAIRDMARDFARREIDPIVEEFDEAQRFQSEIFDQLGELGFLGILIPEEYGGSELGYVEYAAPNGQTLQCGSVPRQIERVV